MSDSPEWISYQAAQTRLGCGYKALRNLVDAGKISALNVPGSRPKVLAADVDQLAQASRRMAKPHAQAAAVAL